MAGLGTAWVAGVLGLWAGDMRAYPLVLLAAAGSLLRAGTFTYRASGTVDVRTPLGRHEVPSGRLHTIGMRGREGLERRLGALLDPNRDVKQFGKLVPTDNANVVSIEVRDPKRPEFGMITLIFTRNSSAPGGLQLTNWVALDSQNHRTTVRLSNQPLVSDPPAYTPRSKRLARRYRAVATDLKTGQAVEETFRLKEVRLTSDSAIASSSRSIVAPRREAGVGAPVKITGMVRFALGEGIEKKSEDFAAEVAAAAAGTA